MWKKRMGSEIYCRFVGIALFLTMSICIYQPAYSQEKKSDFNSELNIDLNPETNSSAPFVESNLGSDIRQGSVVVEKIKDYTLPYKQRRNNWGVLFSINYEQFYPEEYTSLVLSSDYKTITGDKNIPLLGAELGVKYNFSLGSISALMGYSQGKIENLSKGLEQITMSVGKLDLNYALDNLMEEPYLVPYAQIGIHTIDWLEKGVVGSVKNEESFKTEPNFHFKVGLSIQLNWIEKSIDPSSIEDSIRSGLENTYIDVFYTSYSQPAQVANADGASGEANLQSSQIGAGLKLEF